MKHMCAFSPCLCHPPPTLKGSNGQKYFLLISWNTPIWIWEVISFRLYETNFFRVRLTVDFMITGMAKRILWPVPSTWASVFMRYTFLNHLAFVFHGVERRISEIMFNLCWSRKYHKYMHKFNDKHNFYTYTRFKLLGNHFTRKNATRLKNRHRSSPTVQWERNYMVV